MVLHSYACSLGLPDLFISIEITSWELIPEELNLTDLVKLCGVVDPIPPHACSFEPKRISTETYGGSRPQ